MGCLFLFQKSYNVIYVLDDFFKDVFFLSIRFSVFLISLKKFQGIFFFLDNFI